MHHRRKHTRPRRNHTRPRRSGIHPGDFRETRTHLPALCPGQRSAETRRTHRSRNRPDTPVRTAPCRRAHRDTQRRRDNGAHAATRGKGKGMGTAHSHDKRPHRIPAENRHSHRKRRRSRHAHRIRTFSPDPFQTKKQREGTRGSHKREMGSRRTGTRARAFLVRHRRHIRLKTLRLRRTAAPLHAENRRGRKRSRALSQPGRTGNRTHGKDCGIQIAGRRI